MSEQIKQVFLQRTYFKTMIVFAFLISRTGLKAQIINVDKTDTLQYSSKTKFDGSLSLGLEIDKQNSVLYDGTNFIDAAIKKNKTFIIFSGSNRFTYNQTQDLLNTGYLHIRLRNHYKARLHPESFIQFQWDNKIGFANRMVAGENIRYDLIHNNDWELIAATGLMYEKEDWNYSGVDTSKHLSKHPNVYTNIFKSNNYIKIEGKVSNNSSLKLALFYQSQFTTFFSPRIFSVINFIIDASKHFGIGFNFAGTYDSKPIVPITNFYYSVSNNLVYKF